MTERPTPHPDGPFGKAPKVPALPEYDTLGVLNPPLAAALLIFLGIVIYLEWLR
jgi:hypothetical protein